MKIWKKKAKKKKEDEVVGHTHGMVPHKFEDKGNEGS